MFGLLLLLSTFALAAPPSAEGLVPAMSPQHVQMVRTRQLESIPKFEEILGRPGLQGAARAEAELRLAELYLAAGQLSEDPVLLEEATQRLRAFTRTYPAHTRHDEALFHLGRSLAFQGYKDQSVGVLQELIRTWPQSHYVADAYAHLGDHYLSSAGGEPSPYKALLCFQKAATYREAHVSAYAEYGLARAYLRVGERSKAVRSMEAVQARLADPRLLPEVAEPLRAWVAQELAAGFPDGEAWPPPGVPEPLPEPLPAEPAAPPPDGIQSWEDAAGIGP